MTAGAWNPEDASGRLLKESRTGRRTAFPREDRPVRGCGRGGTRRLSFARPGPGSPATRVLPEGSLGGAGDAVAEQDLVLQDRRGGAAPADEPAGLLFPGRRLRSGRARRVPVLKMFHMKHCGQSLLRLTEKEPGACRRLGRAETKPETGKTGQILPAGFRKLNRNFAGSQFCRGSGHGGHARRIAASGLRSFRKEKQSPWTGERAVCAKEERGMADPASPPLPEVFSAPLGLPSAAGGRLPWTNPPQAFGSAEDHRFGRGAMLMPFPAGRGQKPPSRRSSPRKDTGGILSSGTRRRALALHGRGGPPLTGRLCRLQSRDSGALCSSPRLKGEDREPFQDFCALPEAVPLQSVFFDFLRRSSMSAFQSSGVAMQ